LLVSLLGVFAAATGGAGSGETAGIGAALFPLPFAFPLPFVWGAASGAVFAAGAGEEACVVDVWLLLVSAGAGVELVVSVVVCVSPAVVVVSLPFARATEGATRHSTSANARTRNRGIARRLCGAEAPDGSLSVPRFPSPCKLPVTSLREGPQHIQTAPNVQLESRQFNGSNGEKTRTQHQVDRRIVAASFFGPHQSNAQGVHAMATAVAIRLQNLLVMRWLRVSP
jgi:hypothetical protein